MKLKIVDTPEPREKLQITGDRAPLVRDHGLQNYHCAACGEVLLVQMNPMDLVDAAFQCPTCGKWNALDLDNDGNGAAA